MDRIVREETELLERVTTLLAEEPYLAPPSEAEIVAELVRLREELPRAKEEDKGSILEQFNQQYSLLQQLRDARGKAEVDPDSPYFGHLQLREGGRVRDLCLGKATRIQRGVRIVDWRNAPVSRIFYGYQQGDEYEEDIGEKTLVGEVLARRTVTIRRGRLERVDAPEGIWANDPEAGWHLQERVAPRLAGGEGTAMQVHQPGEGERRRLGTDLAGSRRRADKHLPDIAGLIDPEQFALITRPSSGFVVIRGTAGSGKTTVALHRIAYLAFNDPGIDSPRTLFLVFSKALKEYVSRVLPALGVPRVATSTFGEWVATQRRHHFPHLPRRTRETTPSWVTRVKLHPALMVALERHVHDVEGPATAEQAVDDWSSVLTQLDVLAPLLDRVAPGAFSRDVLEQVTEWSRDRHQELLAWLDGDKEVDAELDPEDDALLLRAWQLRVGPLRHGRKPLRYRHVAIDEVQDFSPIEVRVLLGCLDERRSITLAGDTQQHVMKDAGFTSWAEFFGFLGVQGTAIETLRVSYRSSRPIVAFAMALLGDLREDDELPLTPRDGPAVELFHFTDHGACVAFLADALDALMRAEPLASVAVLAPDAATANLYAQGLVQADVPRLRRVEDQGFSFAPGVEIVEIEDVKGLEFDYVVLLETSARHYPDTAAARRLLHVGATRAVHQLWLTSVGTPSPVVREAMEVVGQR